MLDDGVGFIHRQSNPNRWCLFNYMVRAKDERIHAAFDPDEMPYPPLNPEILAHMDPPGAKSGE
jgi:hypothetical protein